MILSFVNQFQLEVIANRTHVGCYYITPFELYKSLLNGHCSNDIPFLHDVNVFPIERVESGAV